MRDIIIKMRGFILTLSAIILFPTTLLGASSMVKFLCNIWGDSIMVPIVGTILIVNVIIPAGYGIIRGIDLINSDWPKLRVAIFGEKKDNA